MKPLTYWMLLSYSVLVTVWLLAEAAQSPPPVDSQPIPRLEPRPLSAEAESPTAMSSHHDAALADGSPALVWGQIETDDFGTYIQKLRAIGCPEVTIRRIVTAEIHGEYAQRRREFLATEPIPFWKSEYGVGEESLPGMLALEDEERAALSAVLGKPEGPDSLECAAVKVAGSWAGKGPAIATAAWSRNAERDAILEAADGRPLTAAEQARIGQLAAEYEQALVSILSPAEREEYELRNSAPAENLRSELGKKGVEVSEREFRELFRSLRQFNAAEHAMAMRSGDIGAAWDTYLAAASRVLGPERFEGFK